MSEDAVIDLTPGICKNCVPVFYEAGEVPAVKPGTLVLKHVALCPRHAAAADLLEACKRVLGDIESMDYGGEISVGTAEDLKAAIAKAEGRS